MSNPVTPSEQYYSTSKVAELFDVTPETVVSWIKTGKLEAVKINSRWRVPRESVIAFGSAKFTPDREEV